MKKFLSILLALALVLSLGTVAFAEENQDASFSKTYKITNAGTENPAEEFEFTFTAKNVTDTDNVTVENMPKIPNATVNFNEGTAATEGFTQSVAVALADVDWPDVGIYYYDVKEVEGNTAGVTYDNKPAVMKVTVAFDENRNTYYTAFVTLSLADNNEDGKTDEKTAGFTNEYSAGVLEISKEVTGNMGDQNKYFEVDVTLTGEAGKEYAESYEVTGGSSEANNPTSIVIGTTETFKLKHGDTITIKNLPYGVTYTVVEKDYTTEENGGYEAPVYKWSDEERKEIDSAKDTVTITNEKTEAVDTGVFMDSLPYVLLLVGACAGLVVFFARRRMTHKG